MPLILETGAGVQNANSYILPAFVTTYLTERGRETENTWSTSTTAQQEAACIAATDYIDSRWGRRFKGVKATRFAGAKAIARVDFTDVPTALDTLTLGDQVYTFVASLSDFANGEVLIGANAAATVVNLIAAINGNTSNENFSRALEANYHAEAAAESGSDVQIRLTARQEGLAGNDITFTESADNTTIFSTFVNGRDEGSQTLEFPRASLFDQDGQRVIGIPVRLKQAAAEYAVRAIGSALYRDPTIDDTGRTVTEKFEKVGPIEERTVYEEGAALSQLIKPYPSADRLLADYVRPSGAVR